MATTLAESPKAEERRWKIESAANTLIEAAKIKKDKKLYKAAIAELKKRRAAIGEVMKLTGR
jgi:hypothetical protein